MIRVSVIYRGNAEAFDQDYYFSTHMPLVESLYTDYGLLDWQVDKGSALSSKQTPDFLIAAHMVFESMQAVKTAFKEKGADVMADVKNFTSITPEMLIAEIIAQKS